MDEYKRLELQDQPPWLVINNPYRAQGIPDVAEAQANFTPLTEEETAIITLLYNKGATHYKIANVTGRSLSAIGRKLKALKKEGTII